MLQKGFCIRIFLSCKMTHLGLVSVSHSAWEMTDRAAVWNKWQKITHAGFEMRRCQQLKFNLIWLQLRTERCCRGFYLRWIPEVAPREPSSKTEEVARWKSASGGQDVAPWPRASRRPADSSRFWKCVWGCRGPSGAAVFWWLLSVIDTFTWSVLSSKDFPVPVFTGSWPHLPAQL